MHVTNLYFMHVLITLSCIDDMQSNLLLNFNDIIVKMQF